MKKRLFFPKLPSGIPCGGMPGDSVMIGPEHEMKARLIFSRLDGYFRFRRAGAS